MVEWVWISDCRSEMCSYIINYGLSTNGGHWFEWPSVALMAVRAYDKNLPNPNLDVYACGILLYHFKWIFFPDSIWNDEVFPYYFRFNKAGGRCKTVVKSKQPFTELGLSYILVVLKMIVSVVQAYIYSNNT